MVLNVQISVSRMTIFRILIRPIHDNVKLFHLLVCSSISSFIVLEFSLQWSLASLIRFLAMCLFSLQTNVNGFIALNQFSYILSLVTGSRLSLCVNFVSCHVVKSDYRLQETFVHFKNLITWFFASFLKNSIYILNISPLPSGKHCVSICEVDLHSVYCFHYCMEAFSFASVCCALGSYCGNDDQHQDLKIIPL